MSLSEFKAWLEGYSASFKDGVPNAEQWAEVQARLEKVVLVSSGAFPLGPPPERRWGTLPSAGPGSPSLYIGGVRFGSHVATTAGSDLPTHGCGTC